MSFKKPRGKKYPSYFLRRKNRSRAAHGPQSITRELSSTTTIYQPSCLYNIHAYTRCVYKSWNEEGIERTALVANSSGTTLGHFDESIPNKKRNRNLPLKLRDCARRQQQTTFNQRVSSRTFVERERENKLTGCREQQQRHDWPDRPTRHQEQVQTTPGGAARDGTRIAPTCWVLCCLFNRFSLSLPVWRRRRPPPMSRFHRHIHYRKCAGPAIGTAQNGDGRIPIRTYVNHYWGCVLISIGSIWNVVFSFSLKEDVICWNAQSNWWGIPAISIRKIRTSVQDRWFYVREQLYFRLNSVVLLVCLVVGFNIRLESRAEMAERDRSSGRGSICLIGVAPLGVRSCFNIGVDVGKKEEDGMVEPANRDGNTTRGTVG